MNMPSSMRRIQIISPAHILAATFKAVRALLDTLSPPTNIPTPSLLRTRNVHSEIVFSLSPNNNITESFTTFGLNQHTSKSLLAIKIQLLPSSAIKLPSIPLVLSLDANAIISFLTKLVLEPGAESMPFDEQSLWEICNVDGIKRRYVDRLINAATGLGTNEAGGGGGGGGGGGTGGKRRRRKKKVEVGVEVDGRQKLQKKLWSEGGRETQKEIELRVLAALALRAVS